MEQKIPFLGQGWSFPPEFNPGAHGVKMLSDEEDIRSSLEILLGTSVGERIMRPTYGCNLKDYLFESLDAGLRAYLEDMIESAILYHEARISLDGVSLTAHPEEGRVDIRLDYTILTTNSRYNHVYPFYIREGEK